MNRKEYIQQIQAALDEAVHVAKKDTSGRVAEYIPELAEVDVGLTSAAITLVDGTSILSGDAATHRFTLQSAAKLVVLIGLLEEFGSKTVLSWTNAEPSGQPFASLAQVERFGNVPSNPMINAGAIALCSRIPGDNEERRLWLESWCARLFGEELVVNQKVFASEMNTGDRNRSIAYLLRSNNIILLPVEDVLDTYYYLCSFESDIKTASYLGALLANGGIAPDGTKIFSEKTCNIVVSIMATCGLYDESGSRLVRYGMPAKSAVSGLIIASATGRAGVAVCSPRLNDKAGSVRGHIILEEVSNRLHFHFASPWGYYREGFDDSSSIE